MSVFARMPLKGGGSILLEDVEGVPEFDGAAMAGRLGDVVRELPRSLQESLVLVWETARTVLDQLREAGPPKDVTRPLTLLVREGSAVGGRIVED